MYNMKENVLPFNYSFALYCLFHLFSSVTWSLCQLRGTRPSRRIQSTDWRSWELLTTAPLPHAAPGAPSQRTSSQRRSCPPFERRSKHPTRTFSRTSHLMVLQSLCKPLPRWRSPAHMPRAVSIAPSASWRSLLQQKQRTIQQTLPQQMIAGHPPQGQSSPVERIHQAHPLTPPAPAALARPRSPTAAAARLAQGP